MMYSGGVQSTLSGRDFFFSEIKMYQFTQVSTQIYQYLTQNITLSNNIQEA